MGGETVSETDEHIHADSLPFDCLKMQTRTHGCTHAHRQTHLLSAAGRIWSLFKSLNYSWLKIHGEPFIWKLGAVQAALWCLIGLKVANPLNKSGRRVAAACVLWMRMWVFTTHQPFISRSFSLSLYCPAFVYCTMTVEPQKVRAENMLYLWYAVILWKEQDLETQPTFVLTFGLCTSFLVALNWELWKIICLSYDTGAFFGRVAGGGVHCWRSTAD